MTLVVRVLASGLGGSIGARISAGKVFKTSYLTIFRIEHFRHPGSQISPLWASSAFLAPSLRLSDVLTVLEIQSAQSAGSSKL